MASPKGCPDNSQARSRQRSPQPRDGGTGNPRQCGQPSGGVQIRPQSGRGSPQRAPPQTFRPTVRTMPPGNAQVRPTPGRAPPQQMPPYMGSPGLDLMTSGEMSTFDCSGGGGLSGLYTSDESRYSPYGNSNVSSTLPSSYYGNSSGGGSSPSAPLRTRTTTSTTIITTEDNGEGDDDIDDDDDEDDFGASPAGGLNATYTRGAGGAGGGGPGGGGRNATYNCPPASGNSTYNIGGGGGGGPGGAGGATYTRSGSPCSEYTSDFSDFDYDTGNYSTTPPMGLYSTYTIEPASFEVGPPRPPLRGPMPGPGVPVAGPGSPGAGAAHNKTFTKIIKKVITESPSSGMGMGGQNTTGSSRGAPCPNEFSRGIRAGAQSTPKLKPGAGGAGSGYGSPGGGGGGPSYGSPGRPNYGGMGGGPCPPQGGAGYGGHGPSGASGGGAYGGMGASGGYGGQKQSGGNGGCCDCDTQSQNQGLAGEVQRHLEELETTEREQINTDLATFQQARRRLVEVTTTISSTQPPVNFSGR